MSSEPERRNITIRRAPKIIPFLVIGALLGLIGAGIIAFTGPEGSDFSRGTVLGFFSVLLLIPGLLLGALAALLFDWISVRRSRSAVVESTEEEQAAPSQSADDEQDLLDQSTDQSPDISDRSAGHGTDDGPSPERPRS